MSLEIMSIDQVAEALGVTKRTVYEHVERNRIPHRRLGRRILFSRAALEAWLSGKENAA